MLSHARISSFIFFGFLKYFKGWDSHVAQDTPQNDGVGGWDSHVAQDTPQNDGVGGWDSHVAQDTPQNDESVKNSNLPSPLC